MPKSEEEKKKQRERDKRTKEFLAASSPNIQPIKNRARRKIF